MSGYGDQTSQTDKYSNSNQKTGGDIGAHVTHTGGGEYETGGNTGVTQSTGEKYESGGVLDQSKNSEYDEQGGKKKESIIDKIKDKLPGGNKEQVPTTGQDIYGQGHGGTTAPREEGVTYGADGQPEKKGFVEKIKEKLPGGHN